MADSLGTVKKHFGKSWIYVNPNALKGPNTWDVAAFPLITDGCINNVSSLVPITSNQFYGDVEIGFDIQALPRRSNVTRTQTQRTTALVSLQSLTPGPHPRTVCIKAVNGINPVQQETAREKTTLYLNILSLPFLREIPGWSSNTGVAYNVTRNINGITADEPMVSELSGDEINVSFNINLLPAV